MGFSEQLDGLISHLKDEADFNLSWTDGRRDPGIESGPEYRKQRTDIAAQRNSWVAAIEAVISKCTPGPYKVSEFKCGDGTPNAGVVSSSTGGAVCWASGGSDIEQYQNARVIADALNKLSHD